MLVFYKDQTSLHSAGTVGVAVEEVLPLLQGTVCVVLHCCHGLETATVLHEHGIPFVVLFDGRLDDRAALRFSKSFYGSLFAGKGIRASFDAGQTAAGELGSSYHLLARDGADDLTFF
eukprot:m.265275 g.265275  ORF g.265275 m.265275 type:complete len:118 (+) comp11060_c0_seq5:1321-1674(+)